MSRFQITLMLLLCSLACVAQTFPAIDLETRDKVRSFYGLEDDQGETAVLLRFSDRYLVLQFDKKLNIKGRTEFSLPKGNRYQFLGGKYSSDHFTFYFEAAKTPKSVQSMAVSRSDFSTTPGIASLELGRNWERWGHLFSGNELFMVFISQIKSVAKILRTDENGRFEERDFELSNLDKVVIAEKTQRYKSMLDLNANNAINTDKTVSLSESYSRKKLYNYQGNPVISIENYRGSYNTGFKIFDFETGEVTEKKFSDNELNSRNRNSFLYESKVFIVQYSDEDVYMAVRDFENNELLASYKSHTPVGDLLIPERLKREGGALLQKSEWVKEKRILAKLRKEAGAIAVSQQGGDYLLTLGAYSERNTGGGGGFWDSSGMYIPTFYYSEGQGSTLFYNFTMDKESLRLKFGLPTARTVDIVLNKAKRAGGDNAVSKSRGILPWRGRNIIAYQGLKDRKLYLTLLDY